MDDQFEDLIEKNCQDASIKSTFALIAIFGLSAFMLYAGIATSMILLFLVGIGAGLTGFYTAKKYSGEFKGGKFWLTLIKEKPDNIVWIKPIVTSHTVGFVLTLYKERKFQFLTKDGLKIIMLCDSDKDLRIFYEGLKKYLSTTHLGYSPEMELVYDENPADFINNLQKKGLYTPIRQLRFE